MRPTPEEQAAAEARSAAWRRRIIPPVLTRTTWHLRVSCPFCGFPAIFKETKPFHILIDGRMT